MSNAPERSIEEIAASLHAYIERWGKIVQERMTERIEEDKHALHQLIDANLPSTKERLK
jgi:hypothetical protein